MLVAMSFIAQEVQNLRSSSSPAWLLLTIATLSIAAVLVWLVWLIVRRRPVPGAWLTLIRAHAPLLIGVHLLIFTAAMFGMRLRENVAYSVTNEFSRQIDAQEQKKSIRESFKASTALLKDGATGQEYTDDQALAMGYEKFVINRRKALSDMNARLAEVDVWLRQPLYSEWPIDSWLGPSVICAALLALVVLLMTSVSEKWAHWRGDIMLFAGVIIGCGIIGFIITQPSESYPSRWEHYLLTKDDGLQPAILQPNVSVIHGWQYGWLVNIFPVALLIASGLFIINFLPVQSTQSRLSRMALWGVPLLVLSPLGVPIATSICGAIAVVQIKRSAGTLYGLRRRGDGGTPATVDADSGCVVDGRGGAGHCHHTSIFQAVRGTYRRILGGFPVRWLWHLDQPRARTCRRSDLAAAGTGHHVFRGPCPVACRYRAGYPCQTRRAAANGHSMIAARRAGRSPMNRYDWIQVGVTFAGVFFY